MFRTICDLMIVGSMIRGLFVEDTYDTLNTICDRVVPEDSPAAIQGLMGFCVGYVAGPGVSCVYGAKALGQDAAKGILWVYDKATNKLEERKLYAVPDPV
jgi:hypothetical protein